MKGRAVLMHLWLLLGLCLAGCHQLVRYTNCTESARDPRSMTCRRMGTDYYREFTCQSDGRCLTSGAGHHPKVFVEER